MRTGLIVIGLLVVAALGFVGFRAWQFAGLWPAPSTEIVQLTQQKRAILGRLRSEAKFGPHVYPPIGYPGAQRPEDRAQATAAVNGVIDAVLARPNGPVEARTVSDLIGREMQSVELLDTEDRERTQDYMVEIWYLLGFKGATGRFAYGGASPMPPGYGEPLPPGWSAPDKPRPIG